VLEVPEATTRPEGWALAVELDRELQRVRLERRKLWRCVTRLRESRAAARAEVRALKQRVRALESSRDEWRTRAKAYQRAAGMDTAAMYRRDRAPE